MRLLFPFSHASAQVLQVSRVMCASSPGIQDALLRVVCQHQPLEPVMVSLGWYCCPSTAMKCMLTTIFHVGLDTVWSVCQNQITMNNMEGRDDVSCYQGPKSSSGLGDKVYNIQYLSECLPLCRKANMSPHTLPPTHSFNYKCTSRE